MSHLPAILNPSDEDLQMLLACNVHIGAKNSNTHMDSYIYKRRADGTALGESAEW